jgi:hypothetical protein
MHKCAPLQAAGRPHALCSHWPPSQGHRLDSRREGPGPQARAQGRGKPRAGALRPVSQRSLGRLRQEDEPEVDATRCRLRAPLAAAERSAARCPPALHRSSRSRRPSTVTVAECPFPRLRRCVLAARRAPSEDGGARWRRLNARSLAQDPKDMPAVPAQAPQSEGDTPPSPLAGELSVLTLSFFAAAEKSSEVAELTKQILALQDLVLTYQACAPLTARRSRHTSVTSSAARSAEQVHRPEAQDEQVKSPRGRCACRHRAACRWPGRGASLTRIRATSLAGGGRVNAPTVAAVPRTAGVPIGPRTCACTDIFL